MSSGTTTIITHATMNRRADRPMPAAEQRVDHVAAVELADRQQVERRHQQPDPSGERDRMKVDVDRVGIDAQHHVRQRPEQDRIAELKSAAGVSSGDTSESFSPITTASTASTAPAHGPAAPMSNITRRVRAGDRIRMNAPKVPMKKIDGNGAGMKYGGLTSTLCRATR